VKLSAVVPMLLATAMLGGNALADTYSVSTAGGPAYTIIPSADSMTLNANATTTSLGEFILQTGTFYVGDSGYLSATIPFTYTENVTINGDTESITLSAQDVVTNPNQANTDVLTIFAGSSKLFAGAGVYLNTEAYVSPGLYVGQSAPITLKATLTAVPEPSSLAFIGFALLGILLCARFRSKAALAAPARAQ
jgi:hypothetical protein